MPETPPNKPQEQRKVLVTGGCGFIGGALLSRLVPRYGTCRFVNFDALRHGARPEVILHLDEQPNYDFMKGAVEDPEDIDRLFTMHSDITDIIHLAAETDVDRSIKEPVLKTNASNVIGTINLLEWAGKNRRFVYVSTDEVYGSIGRTDPDRVETDPMRPSNPYSASKAAAEHYVMAYYNTYKSDVVITRGSNTFGPYQDHTKFIPTAMRHLRDKGKIPLYGDGRQIREWLPVDDHAAGIELVWQKGVSGEIYNISTGVSMENHHLAMMLINSVDAPHNAYEYVADRPGHDYRYGISNEKIRKLGWECPNKFKVVEKIRGTARWYYQQRND